MNHQGSDGDDRLAGSAGADALSGGGGNDTLFGSDGEIYHFLPQEGRAYPASTGGDTLDGGAGDDLIIAGHLGADDSLSGGSGDDQLEAHLFEDPARPGFLADHDTLAGGEGHDLAVLTLYSAHGLTLDLSSGTCVLIGRDTTLTLSGIEALRISLWGPCALDLIGTAGDDQLTGSYLTIIHGVNDTLQGGGGADFLDGMAGDDLLRGGTGRDSLHGQGGHDRLIGGGGNDRLYGDSPRGAFWAEKDLATIPCAAIRAMF